MQTSHDLSSQSALRGGPWGRPLVIARGIFIFLAIVIGLRVVQYVLFTRHLPKGALTQPVGMLTEEAIRAGIVLVATAVLARVEKQSVTAYGLAGAHKIRLMLQGLAWGFGIISVVIGLQWSGGNVELSLDSATALSRTCNALLWLLAFVAVAVFEELLLRGYLQYVLARGIGFWGSAIVWSTVFALMHVGNDNESVLGLLQTGIVALFFCLTLRLTGSLWWVIGYHAAWDWGESYFYGVPDSGLLFSGRLMTATEKGNALWSGGAGGPEASLWAFLVLLLPAAALIWQYRERMREAGGVAGIRSG